MSLIEAIDYALEGVTLCDGAAILPPHKAHNDPALYDLLQKCREQLRWVPVSERLPEINQPVALININQWENTGGDHERNVQDMGYLSDFGGKYWSVRGERGKTLDSYTHWLPIDPPQGE